MKLSSLMGLAVVLVTTNAFGHSGISKLAEHDFSLGPTVAYANQPKVGGGLMYGIDATYAPIWTFWLSLGVRAFEGFESNERAALPYVESGFWFLFNFGAGYTFDTKRDDTSYGGPHLFVGFPWTLDELNLGKTPALLFVEPYFRPAFSQDGTLYETGLMLKLTTWRGH